MATTIGLSIPPLTSWQDVLDKAAIGGLVMPYTTADGSAYATDPVTGLAYYLGKLQVPAVPDSSSTGVIMTNAAGQPAIAVSDQGPVVLLPNFGAGQGGGQGPVPVLPLAIGGSTTPAWWQQLMALFQQLGDAIAGLLGSRGYLWLIVAGVLVLVIARRR